MKNKEIYPEQIATGTPKPPVLEWFTDYKTDQEMWENTVYHKEKWWGAFPTDTEYNPLTYTLPEWAVGPFIKYEGNPVLAPTPNAWDQGFFGGGVHNGAIIVKDDKFYYIYRGEGPIDIPTETRFNFVSDIGIAVSEDGHNFTKLDDYSPLFRESDEGRKYIYFDVNVTKFGNTYYLFCNRFYWDQMDDPSVSGVFMATSTDLLHWEKQWLVFPDAKKIHRNPVILQNPQNEAVRATNGKFVMYLNDGIVAYSDDMVRWESKTIEECWPGGENCFALADYSEAHPDRILLFTGGHHTGHFYAIGEVLLSKNDPEKALEWLSKPVIHAETNIPHEFGLSAEVPHNPVSYYRDCIFFTGLTKHAGKWWMYYGGSEYYTCLATAPAE